MKGQLWTEIYIEHEDAREEGISEVWYDHDVDAVVVESFDGSVTLIPANAFRGVLGEGPWKRR